MRLVTAALTLMWVAACGKEGPGIPADDRPVRAVLANADLPIASHDLDLSVGARKFGATVVAPAAPGRWPGLVLLAGSGPTDRDWNNPLLPGKNGSGKLLAEALAHHGMVVIRFDKTGSGGNHGPPLPELSLDTFRDEAQAALDALRARPDVRPDAVFALGHSEGAIHAIRLAAKVGAALRGVILLSAPGRRMVDLVLEQLEGNFRDSAHLPPDQVAQQMQPIAKAFDDFMAGRAVDVKAASAIPQVQRLVGAMTRPATAAMARPLFAFDPPAEAAKLPQASVFLGAGGKDVQVDPAIDTKRLADALAQAHKDVTTFVAPDMNHVLEHEPKTKDELRANLVATQAGYNGADRTLDADFMSALVGWLAAQTR
jgi:pimeloyl-ACP methyl ester carboxylesterase